MVIEVEATDDGAAPKTAQLNECKGKLVHCQAVSQHAHRGRLTPDNQTPGQLPFAFFAVPFWVRLRHPVLHLDDLAAFPTTKR